MVQVIFLVLFFTLLIINTKAHDFEGLKAWLWRWFGRNLLWGSPVAMLLPIPAESLPVAIVVVIVCLPHTIIGGFVLRWVLQYFGLGGGGNGDTHRRGGRLLSEQQLQKIAGREHANFRIGTVPVPERVEPFHFLIAGGTGSGKSQAFHQILGSAREMQQLAIVPDVGGEFTSKYYNPADGDVILNPADRRCADWSPLAEMRSEFDADTLAKSLCPDKPGPENEWQHYSQTLISAVLQRLYEAGTGTNAELVRLLTVAKSEELEALVEGLPAQALFDAGASRMLSSIRAIVATYIKPLAWLNPTTGEGGFSIRRHVEDGKTGWIFMPVRNDQLTTLKPLISAQVDIAIGTLLTLQPDSARRVWFAIDEFASWGRIQSIEPLLTKARKNGGCGVLGIQSVSQVKETYGRDNAQTLLSCLGTWLTLRAGDPETAEFISKYIGDEEVRRVTSGGSDQGKSWQEQITKQRAIMPADLQNLQDRVGILNVVGAIPAGWVSVPVCQRPVLAPPFIEKERQRVTILAKQKPEPDMANLLDEPA